MSRKIPLLLYCNCVERSEVKHLFFCKKGQPFWTVLILFVDIKLNVASKLDFFFDTVG